MLPPADCRDQRLWLQAHDLAAQHVAERGFCIVCGTTAPCRIQRLAEEALSRAMAPLEPDPAPEVQHEPRPEPPPVEAQPRAVAPVGARFRHVQVDDDWPAVPDEPVAPPEPVEQAETPVGARFWRESRVGRRRRSG